MGRTEVLRVPGSVREHPVPNSEKMELRHFHRLGAWERDAASDYPESGSEASVVRLRTGKIGAISGAGAGGRSTTSSEQSGQVFGLWEASARLRHARDETVRVCTVVGDRSVLALRDAPGVVPALWGEGRGGAVGDGQASESPTATRGFWPDGRGGCRGRRWPWSSTRAGRKCSARWR